jgi:DNA-binding response OmpR family regulator
MKACAFVVGPEDGSGAVLKQLARQIGFDAVYVFKDIADAERQSVSTPLIFFLFAAVDNLRRLKPVTEAVRASPSQRVRFSPMIYFSETPSLDAIKSCINMGFDDVITLPFSISRVEERLDRQVDRTLVYYETPSYFGPDRRNRLENEEGHSARGTGGQFRRIEIVRSPTAGISVMRDDSEQFVV